MLTLDHISRTYSISGKPKVEALKNITLSLPEKGLVVLLGKSGAGKTTLLNLLGGVDKPTDGTISYNGQIIDYKNNKLLDAYRGYVVSFVFQDYNLLRDYSVLENVKLSVQLQGKKTDEISSLAVNALDMVGLSGFEKRKVDTLSGGQQQRVAIARAIAKDSKIVLCDEPTGNLDSNTSKDIFTLIKKLSADRLFIVVTHDEEKASEYADCVIRLSDGVVVSDKSYQEDLTDSKDGKNGFAEANELKKRVHGLSLKNKLLMIKDNVVKALFANLIMLILLAATFALSSLFISLFQYNEQNAFLSTLKTNNQYLLPVIKYIDQPQEEADEKTGEIVVTHGPVYYYGATAQEELNLLSQAVKEKAAFYPAYFFHKNLQDFTDAAIYTDLTAFQYVAYGFNEVIVVEDFDTFYTPLLAGNYPEKEDEVLLYDYMAYSLVSHGVLEGDLWSVVGKTLTDRHTGLTFTISGLLDSNYEDYAYLLNEKGTDYEETYLTSLQVMFCRPELLEEIVKEQNYFSLNKVYFYADDALVETDIKKMKYVDIQSLHFIAAVPEFQEERGIVLSCDAAANILGIEKEDLTKETAEWFLENVGAEGLYTYYDFSYERNYISYFGYQIIGIADNFVEEDQVIAFYTPHQEDLYMNNGEFRQIYASLGNDWNANREVIDYFWLPVLSDEFYAENPDYYAEGFTSYSPYGFLIQEANTYLMNVKDFAGQIMYILIALSIICVLLYTFLTLQKYDYKIGVLKALGAKTGNIVSVFGMQLLIISIMAFALSIPASILIMNRVNDIFTKDLNKNLVLFSMKANSVWISFVFATAGVAVIAAIPLLRLSLASPMKVMKAGRKKL